MAPKKQEAPKERPLLGRFKSNLKMGIVGMPNVGKSTLFNLLTRVGVPAESEWHEAQGSFGSRAGPRALYI